MPDGLFVRFRKGADLWFLALGSEDHLTGFDPETFLGLGDEIDLSREDRQVGGFRRGEKPEGGSANARHAQGGGDLETGLFLELFDVDHQIAHLQVY